jgi:hypothetical protein
MRFACFLSLFSIALYFGPAVEAADLFNYGRTSGTDYGPDDWDKVSCGNVGSCVSYW